MGSRKVIGNRSDCHGPEIFWQASSEGLKGNRDLCAPRKSIESDYPEREQVGSQGGPCHVCNLSLSLSRSSWRHSCQPCKCSVRVIREQHGPDRAQPTSRDAAPQHASAQGQAYFVSRPACKMGPFTAQSGTILCKRLQGQWYVAALWHLHAKNQLYLKGRFTKIIKASKQEQLNSINLYYDNVTYRWVKMKDHYLESMSYVIRWRITVNFYGEKYTDKQT